MKKAAEKHLKYIKEMQTKPWINSKIKDLIKKRKKYKNASSKGGMSDHKKCRNLVDEEAKTTLKLLVWTTYVEKC